MQLTSSPGLDDDLRRDIASVGVPGATAQADRFSAVQRACEAMRDTVHVSLTHRNVRNKEVDCYSCLIPRFQALPWVGAAIRQCQRAEAATIFHTPGAVPGAWPSFSDGPAEWRTLFRDLPTVKKEDVDSFEQDAWSYLVRSAPVVPHIAPASTVASPSVSSTSAAFDTQVISGDLHRLVTNEGLPLLHGSSPTIMLDRDLARYLHAMRGRVRSDGELWASALSMGVPRSAMAPFMSEKFILREPHVPFVGAGWQGRLVSLDDLSVWGAQAGPTTDASQATMFANARGIDTRQFGSLIRHWTFPAVMSCLDTGQPLENLNDGMQPLRVIRLNLMPPAVVYWIHAGAGDGSLLAAAAPNVASGRAETQCVDISSSP
ncbi:hypothetical protein ACPWR0_18440 [Pandoraea pneumonica]|uniref:hypothetical protein n=1 Tax=Pandoraea pneumonica TaxID=2508299 RepID=UPI003CEDADCC